MPSRRRNPHLKDGEDVKEANTEDEAVDIFEEKHEYTFYNGIDSITEIIEHDLFNKKLYFDMDDGNTYILPIEFIARNRAEHYEKSFNNDITESLLKDTLPFFEDNPNAIVDWATKNISWDEIKLHSFKIIKK